MEPPPRLVGRPFVALSAALLASACVVEPKAETPRPDAGPEMDCPAGDCLDPVVPGQLVPLTVEVDGRGTVLLAHGDRSTTPPVEVVELEVVEVRNDFTVTLTMTPEPGSALVSTTCTDPDGVVLGASSRDSNPFMFAVPGPTRCVVRFEERSGPRLTVVVSERGGRVTSISSPQSCRGLAGAHDGPAPGVPGHVQCTFSVEEGQTSAVLVTVVDEGSLREGVGGDCTPRADDPQRLDVALDGGPKTCRVTFAACATSAIGLTLSYLDGSPLPEVDGALQVSEGILTSQGWTGVSLRASLPAGQQATSLRVLDRSGVIAFSTGNAVEIEVIGVLVRNVPVVLSASLDWCGVTHEPATTFTLRVVP